MFGFRSAAVRYGNLFYNNDIYKVKYPIYVIIDTSSGDLGYTP